MQEGAEEVYRLVLAMLPLLTLLNREGLRRLNAEPGRHIDQCILLSLYGEQ